MRVEGSVNGQAFAVERAIKVRVWVPMEMPTCSLARHRVFVYVCSFVNDRLCVNLYCFQSTMVRLLRLQRGKTSRLWLHLGGEDLTQADISRTQVGSCCGRVLACATCMRCACAMCVLHEGVT